MGRLQTMYTSQHIKIVDAASLVDLARVWPIQSAIVRMLLPWNDLESFQVTMRSILPIYPAPATQSASTLI